MTPADRARFVGDYIITWPDAVGCKARIYEEGQKLMISAETAGGAAPPAAQMRWQGGNEFASPLGRMVFDVSDGRVTGVYLARGARPMEGRRVSAP